MCKTSSQIVKGAVSGNGGGGGVDLQEKVRKLKGPETTYCGSGQI